ncbi:DUF1289 domain-containing protein [uncultured Aureimonas sp.]|uniref:DUF1289 domain-containing protein n=1 Tax=uncultured Aureimonas sp. TaxID=1604662 RepID=UPI0025D5B06F|nr:DUF1289 domain-containing protein [uncultured Aureimonas sp.]
MAKTFTKAPSPCVSVCKFKIEGQCIACRMTKPEKKRFKRLEGKGEKRAFLAMLSERLQAAGRYAYWSRMYRRRCEKKGRPCPLDKLEADLDTGAKAA